MHYSGFSSKYPLIFHHGQDLGNESCTVIPISTASSVAQAVFYRKSVCILMITKEITISVAQAVVYRTQKCLYSDDHELTIIIISSRNLSRDASMWENVINLKYYYTGNDCKINSVIQKSIKISSIFMRQHKKNTASV